MSFFLLHSPSPLALAAQAPTIPPEIESSDLGRTIWTGLSVLLTPEGDLSLSKLRDVPHADWLRKHLTRHRSVAVPKLHGDCDLDHFVNGAPRTTVDLEIIASVATTGVRGRVEASASGLFEGSPMVLLRLVYLEWLGKTTFQADTAYLLYPSPMIDLGEITVCGDIGWPLAPQAGAQVLALPDRPPVALIDGSPVYLVDYGIVIETIDGRLLAHDRVEEASSVLTPASSLRELTDSLRRILQER